VKIVQNSLEALDFVLNKAGFRLTLVPSSGIWASWTEQTLSDLRPSFWKFTDADMRVRVYGRPSSIAFPVQRVDMYYTLDYADWSERVKTGIERFVHFLPRDKSKWKHLPYESSSDEEY
jgi:hypothetical protein